MDFCICEDCAKKKRDKTLNVLRSGLPRCLLFGGISLAGVLLSLYFRQRDQVFFLFGLAAILAGLLGVIGTLQGFFAKKQSYQKLDEKAQLKAAAWDLLLDAAPKKNGDEDLTYIPVDSTTLSRKQGDLMILYHLLPDIAVEAYKRIREERDMRPREGAGPS